MEILSPKIRSNIYQFKLKQYSQLFNQITINIKILVLLINLSLELIILIIVIINKIKIIIK